MTAEFCLRDEEDVLRACKVPTAHREHLRHAISMFTQKIINDFKLRKKSVDQNMRRYPNLYQHDIKIIIPIFLPNEEYSTYAWCDDSSCIITDNIQSQNAVGRVFETKKLISYIDTNCDEREMLLDALREQHCDLLTMYNTCTELWTSLNNTLYVENHSIQGPEQFRQFARSFLLRELLEIFESWRSEIISANVKYAGKSLFDLEGMRKYILVDRYQCRFISERRSSDDRIFESRSLLLCPDVSLEFIQTMARRDIIIEISDNPCNSIIQANWQRSNGFANVTNDRDEIDFEIVK